MSEMVKDVTLDNYQWVDKHGDYVLTPIPKNETKRLWAITFVYMGTVADVAQVMGGGVLGTGFGVMDTFIVSLIGSAILAVIGGLLAYISGVTRCTSYINFRPAFGRMGSNIFSTLASAVPNMGWFAILTWQFGTFIHALFPNVAFCNVLPATIWGGCLMALTAYFGIKGLEFFSYLAVPYFILLAIFGVMIAVDEAGSFSGIFDLQPAEPATYGEGITYVVGMMMAMCLVTADIGRYGKTRWSGAIAWTLAMVLQALILAGAAMLMLATGSADVPGALLMSGVGFGAFLMVVLGQWSTNDNNLYYSSLSVGMYARMKRKNLVLVLGAGGIFVAALIAGIWGSAPEPFEFFLGLMGTALPGVGGVVIADFFIFRAYKGEKVDDRYQFQPGDELPEFNWVGWVSALISIIVGGFIIKSGIAAVNTLVLGLVLYAVLAIICDKAKINMYVGKHTLTETGE